VDGGKRVIVNDQNASMTETMALLGRLKTEMPEIWGQAEVVGQWVWLEFNVAPEKQVRGKLRDLGFHWNRDRRCWQHPCGAPSERSRHDPKEKYPVVPASAMELKEIVALPLPPRPAKEYKVVAVRECPLPDDMQLCDTPQKAADYWRLHVQTIPYFNSECECFATLLLNTRRRVKGHQLVSIGTLDTLLVHAREVFRAAIVAAAAALVIMHNHPSGEPTPSEADIKVTRDLIRAGQLLKIEVVDHVIVGQNSHVSLRELGYFYS
jgi:DNA repair protein RadC